MTAFDQLRPLVGIKQACQALAIPRATWYRRRRRHLFPAALPFLENKRRSVRALAPTEQSIVLACLHEERFQDCSPAQVYAALLDEGRFHCSIRTMYRLLETHGESRERRDQLTHPPYQKPELLATQSNQLWSWDITKLRGPVKWTAYPALRHPGCFQPLRRRLDDRPPRKRRVGQAAYPT
jgi:putative transposase